MTTPDKDCRKAFEKKYGSVDPSRYEMWEMWQEGWLARVPAGYVVVPMEPTEKMLNAAEKEWNEITAHTFGDLYRVMIAASQGGK